MKLLSFSRRRASWRVRMVGVLTIAAFVAAACGGNDSDGDRSEPATNGGDDRAAVVEEAKALVAEVAEPVEWEDPGPPIENIDEVRGKTFFYIANGIQLASIQALIRGIEAAAESVGMEVVVTDGAGQPSEIARQMERAVSQRADVIATTSFPAAAIDAALGHASDAGIPVILGFAGDPGLPSEEEEEAGVSALMSFCYSCAGRQMAHATIADSEGEDINAVVFQVPGSPNAELEAQNYVEELERMCPDWCEVEVKDAPLPEWETNLQNLTQSTLRADPTVNYLIPVWDDMVNFINPGVYSVGAQDRVKIITYNADLRVMQDLAKGDLVVTDIGSPLQWAGWALVDQGIRLTTGMPPVEDENIPNRVFNSNNIDEVDLELDDAHWYGVDHAAEYRSLWGAE